MAEIALKVVQHIESAHTRCNLMYNSPVVRQILWQLRTASLCDRVVQQVQQPRTAGNVRSWFDCAVFLVVTPWDGLICRVSPACLNDESVTVSCYCSGRNWHTGVNRSIFLQSYVTMNNKICLYVWRNRNKNWRKMDMTYFKALSWHSCLRAEGNHDRLELG
jgi:hypothetical protein